MSVQAYMPAPVKPIREADVALTGVEVVFTARRASAVYTALADVSVQADRGELVVLVGRSGCGKTTVLNVLAGLVSPTKGSASVFGTEPGDAGSGVGYMFARDALLPWRTATRNIEFALELSRPELGRRERRARAESLLEELGVAGAAQKRYPWQLSQGMRQRVALARTWAIEPRLLLMDEPFAALDAQTRSDAQSLFLDIWSKSNTTVVFVTHDLHEAILLGDRVVVMDSGRIVDEFRVEIDRPRDAFTIVEDPRFQQLHHRLVETITGRATSGTTPRAHKENEVDHQLS
jgi:NitT/TauT family transport system ATP-binding protein